MVKNFLRQIHLKNDFVRYLFFTGPKMCKNWVFRMKRPHLIGYPKPLRKRFCEEQNDALHRKGNGLSTAAS